MLKKKLKRLLGSIKNGFKRNRLFIGLVVFLLILPYITGVVFSFNVVREKLHIDYPSVLSFYGTSLGILASFYLYRKEKLRGELEKTFAARPVLSVKVIQKESCTSIIIKNIGDKRIYQVYLYGFPLIDYLSPMQEVKAKVSDSDESFYLDSSEWDENDRLPQYVLIHCDDSLGDTWECEFVKYKDYDETYYSPKELHLL